MNNYMKRLVTAKKKTNADAGKKKDTKTINPPCEAAPMSTGTTSPVVSRPKSDRRRNHKLAPSSESSTNIDPSSPIRKSKATTHSDQVMKPSNKPSTRRIRQYMRSGNSNSGSKGFGRTPFTTASSGQQTSKNKPGSGNDDIGPPSGDPWMAPAKDSDRGKNTSQSIVDDDIADELRQENAAIIQVKSSESQAQGSIPWDERREPSVSMTSSPIRSVLLQKKNIERELADVKIDRDFLRQQLIEARTELEIARSSLRENVSDLEEQLRSLQHSERRQMELEESALLEEEISELTRLAKEQEDKEAASELHIPIALINRESDDKSGDHSTKVGDGISASIDRAVVFPVNNTGSSSQKECVNEVGYLLNQRRLREEALEAEVRELKEQVQLKSQKFDEAQRQVRWYQQEFQSMVPQENEILSISLPLSEGNINAENDNRQNAAHLETIKESNIDDKRDTGHICGNTVSGDNDNINAIKGENCTDDQVEKTSNDHVSDSSTIIICDNVNQPALVLPSTNSLSHSSSTNISSEHVRLLHKQRLELEHRVQELLDEIGTLRLRHRTSEHEKQQSDIQVVNLQAELHQQQEQHRLELLLVERQLTEWKSRSDLFQTDLEERELLEKQDTRTYLERQELSQRVEELEIEINELKDRLERTSNSFEQSIKSSEKKLQDASVGPPSDITHCNNVDTLEPQEDNSTRIQTAFQKSKIPYHESLKDEEVWKGLLDRIQDLEADREARIVSERALREQLKDMTELAKETNDQTGLGEDRLRVLQTFLDASFSASPKTERQMELEQEYFSVHSRTYGLDENKQGELHQKLSETLESVDIAPRGTPEIVGEKSESIGTTKDDIVSNDTEKTSKSATDPADKSFRSQGRVVKARDVEDQSINSDAVVHNLHLKLEEEMGNLKKRKERRRERAISTASSSDHKYRSILDSTIDFHHSDPTTSDPNVDLSSANFSSPQTLEAPITKKMLSTDSEFNSEQTEVSDKRDCSNAREKNSELEVTAKIKSDHEMRKMLEIENSRLVEALDTTKDEKKQLEGQVKSAMQQITESLDQVVKLKTENREYRSSLSHSERGKDELMEKIKNIQNETTILKCNLAEKEDEKKSLAAKISKLKVDLKEKEEMILENDRSHDTKLKEMEKALDDLSSRREKDHIHVNHINNLEAKIILLETESRTNIEQLSNDMDSTLKERKDLESKFRDARKQLDEYKQNESSLQKLVQENIEKFESSQDALQKLSESKEHEISELGEKISKRDLRIADLETDIICRSKRLEQASIQLTEFENELFERDEEIQKLDAKCRQMQENASKQLVDMERCLEEEGKEINMLEEEKSKLEEIVKKCEHQIEKQVGRLAEASLQLSELECEILAKDDEIEEMELRINAMEALETQRYEGLQESESQKRNLEEQLESANQTILILSSQVDKIRAERESEKSEAQRLLIEDGRKNKEILSRQNQLNRQLQNVSKLTEQTDKWQLQLEKAYDEKLELLDRLSDVEREINGLREELDESNVKIKELKAINIRLTDDLVCATEEGEKNLFRISQMEEQKEALSQELESAVDNLADLKKQNEEVRELEAKLSTDIIDKLQSNLRSAQAVDEETEIHIMKLTEQVEFQRRSLHASQLNQRELETENEALQEQIRLLVASNRENGTDAANKLANTREMVAD